MDDETRAAFARMDRYFELAQAQYQESRGEFGTLRGEVRELRGDVQELRGEVHALRTEFETLRNEFRSFRDWTVAQIAEIRMDLRVFRGQVELRLDRAGL